MGRDRSITQPIRSIRGSIRGGVGRNGLIQSIDWMHRSAEGSIGSGLETEISPCRPTRQARARARTQPNKSAPYCRLLLLPCWFSDPSCWASSVRRSCRGFDVPPSRAFPFGGALPAHIQHISTALLVSSSPRLSRLDNHTSRISCRCGLVRPIIPNPPSLSVFPLPLAVAVYIPLPRSKYVSCRILSYRVLSYISMCIYI